MSSYPGDENFSYEKYLKDMENIKTMSLDAETTARPEDRKKHTPQTIEFENGVICEVDEMGQISFIKHEDNDGETVLFNTSVEELNRINRIIFSGRITNHDSDLERDNRFIPRTNRNPRFQNKS